jgi:predicted amidohydrolase YtcJ
MTSFVLRRARVVEIEPGTGHGPDPLDVRVQDERVIEVGRNLDRPVGVPEYDADGRWLIPGLWDQHVHLAQWAATAGRLDLADANSVAEALAIVAGHLRSDGHRGWVVGWGHRSVPWERQPTVTVLDSVVGPRPVALISGDGHHAWLSTAALDALGLDRRDDMVAETEWFAAYPRLAEATAPPPEALVEAQLAAAARGVVGLVDLEFGMTLIDWASRPVGPLRLRASAYPETLDEVLAAGLRTGDPMPGAGGRTTMGPLKIISDGSLNTRTAWCCEPYADGPGLGAPNYSPAELRDLMAAATSAGLEVATHAIGDRAVAEVLAAYADTQARGSIEHAQLVRREDLPTLASLGLRASVQPAHLVDDRDVTDLCWGDRAERAYMFRTMLDRGVELALGSDAPVAPLDPWLAIATAVHRTGDDRPPWHPQESLSPSEALAASVDGQGTVRAGLPGDLVLVDVDPLADGAPAEQAAGLRAMPVAATWVAGTMVFAGAQALPAP